MKIDKFAITISSVAALRSEPSDHSERIDELLFGMGIKVVSKEHKGWFYIETLYDYEGYISEKDIFFVEEDRLKKWVNDAVFYVEHSTADILLDSKYNSPIIITLPRGAFICLTGKTKDSWTEVILPNYERGWIKTPFLKKVQKYCLKEEKIIRENVVNTAMLYLNTQYRWGGKSSFGIDCSGLCSMAYLLNGYVIYRDAILKDKYMGKIQLNEVKAGDLLFFPGHVAMYIGNDKYIHSNSLSHGVSINSLNPNDADYREDLQKSITDVGSIFR